jgi:hypothetical protein
MIVSVSDSLTEETSLTSRQTTMAHRASSPDSADSFWRNLYKDHFQATKNLLIIGLGEYFPSRESVQQHMDTVHGYDCDICGYTLPTEQELDHIKEAFGVPSPSSTSSLTSLQNSALKSRSAWRSTQGLSNGRTNQTHTLSRPENPRTSCRGMISLGAPARHLRCFMSIRCPGTKARNYTVNSPRHSRLQPYNKPRALASASSSSFYATSNSASSSDSFDNISG